MLLVQGGPAGQVPGDVPCGPDAPLLVRNEATEPLKGFGSGSEHVPPP